LAARLQPGSTPCLNASHALLLLFQVAVLHGEMPKVARQSVLARFRSGKLRALVVSDVVARGLDVADCDAGG
jgi:superfamily II DNA/RNA helicase